MSRGFTVLSKNDQAIEVEIFSDGKVKYINYTSNISEEDLLKSIDYEINVMTNMVELPSIDPHIGKIMEVIVTETPIIENKAIYDEDDKIIGYHDVVVRIDKEYSTKVKNESTMYS